MPKVQPQTSFPNCTKFYIIHGWSALSSAIHPLTDKLLNFLFKLPGIANWGTPLLLPSLVATNWNSNTSCWIVPCIQCCPLIIFLLTPSSANLSLHSPVQNLTSAPIKLFFVNKCCCLTAESLSKPLTSQTRWSQVHASNEFHSHLRSCQEDTVHFFVSYVATRHYFKCK